MIKLYKAFTFVEILVSISIISLMAIVWVSSFQKFFSTQQIARLQEKIVNIKRWLDSDIESWNISSYSLIFASDSYCVIANIDYLNSPQTISLSAFDYGTLSWTLVTNNSSTWTWETKIFIDNVFSNSLLNSWSGNSNKIDLSKHSGFENIKIASTIGSMTTNHYIFYRLDHTKDEWENIENAYIASLKWATYYDRIYMENELWKKTIRTKNWSIYSTAESIDIWLTRNTSELTFTLKP
jgi:type II secretory pathway pseudopilin PulG